MAALFTLLNVGAALQRWDGSGWSKAQNKHNHQHNQRLSISQRRLWYQWEGRRQSAVGSVCDRMAVGELWDLRSCDRTDRELLDIGMECTWQVGCSLFVYAA